MGSTNYMATAQLSQAVPKNLRGSSTTESTVAERAVMMCASALFAGLTHHEILEIASCARARSFARDELLFMQGQSARHLVILQSGSVKLTQLSSNGSEVILRMTGSGGSSRHARRDFIAMPHVFCPCHGELQSPGLGIFQAATASGRLPADSEEHQ